MVPPPGLPLAATAGPCARAHQHLPAACAHPQVCATGQDPSDTRVKASVLGFVAPSVLHPLHAASQPAREWRLGEHVMRHAGARRACVFAPAGAALQPQTTRQHHHPVMVGSSPDRAALCMPSLQTGLLCSLAWRRRSPCVLCGLMLRLAGLRLAHQRGGAGFQLCCELDLHAVARQHTLPRARLSRVGLCERRRWDIESLTDHHHHHGRTAPPSLTHCTTYYRMVCLAWPGPQGGHPPHQACSILLSTSSCQARLLMGSACLHTGT